MIRTSDLSDAPHLGVETHPQELMPTICVPPSHCGPSCQPTHRALGRQIDNVVSDEDSPGVLEAFRGELLSNYTRWCG